MSNTEKKFDKFFVANLKRTYQMVAPAVKEKQKLLKEIEDFQARVKELDDQINALDSHIKTATGGYGVEDLIIRTVVETGKDKEGRPIKASKLSLKYPETVVPETVVPVAENELGNEESEVPSYNHN